MTSLQGASLAATVLGKALMSAPSWGSILELVEEAFRSFDVHEAGDAVGNLFEAVDAEGESHAALAAELIG